jgi:hypothetical protein
MGETGPRLYFDTPSEISGDFAAVRPLYALSATFKRPLELSPFDAEADM